MAKPIKMPKLSDEMTEGKLAEWLKKEGEEVAQGDVVAQVETEKATLDVEAFDSGVLLAIVAEKGATISVGQPIAWIGKRGEKVPESAVDGSGGDAAKEVKAGGEVSQQAAPRVEPQREARPPSPARAPAPPRAPEPPRPAPPASTRTLRVAREAAPRELRARDRVVASPAARKQARERGVDLSSIEGSGPGGRVVLADLERGPAPAPAVPAIPAVVATAAAPAKRRRELPPIQELREETVALSPMRKAIARNLAQAKPGAPHYYLETSADMRRAVVLREQLNDLGEGEVSVNDLVLKATADALRRHPEVNAAWSGDSVVRHGAIHLGMAVAVEDGLITPVIRDADRLSIFELARTARELAGRARQKRLRPEEYQGATFTVSNLGMYGIEAFYAIINPPEAGILAVGAVERMPWVDEGGAIVAMERCRLTLSGDHRVIDGATGARFLQTVKGVLESPLRLVAS